MLVVPTEVRVRYAEFLTQRGVARIYVNKCQKWLRYYLDFCEKYRHETANASEKEDRFIFFSWGGPVFYSIYEFQASFRFLYEIDHCQSIALSAMLRVLA